MARLPWRAAGALLAAACLASSAQADRVTVKGTTLEGTVIAMDSKTVRMKTVYGDGTLTLKLSDVTEIQTDGVFRVYHGEAVTEASTLVVAGDTLQVGATAVPVASLHAVKNTAAGEVSLLERLSLAYPLWSGNFDLAFNYTDATVNSLAFASSLSLRRVEGPSRFLLSVSYLRSTGEDALGDDEGSVFANELRGVTRLEHDLTPRWFAYGSAEGEHDAVERLSFRGIPKAGFGYKLWEVPEKGYLSVDLGGAWVYERYFGGEHNDYFAVAFGAGTSYKLGAGWIWAARVDYLPSVEDWAGDFLLRGETSLVFPLTDHFALKTSLVDLYDATPADGVESNSLQVLVGVSVLF